ncbi:MAG: methyltransferase domain-containing protein [Magnetococcales bacterium]|nr:methyltransferase domain-containing protein [Magnetococcales bacterium]
MNANEGETERYYDASNQRIVCLRNGRDAAFWTAHWQETLREAPRLFANPPGFHLFVYRTRKYLTRGARVIDAGCGLACTVHALQRAGYQAYGVDFSQTTIDTVRAHWPHLHISCHDIRALPFEDHFFDGYWSLGVIEHFYQGYDEVLAEMRRTIRPGGYLFLTFPSMTWLRRQRARAGRLPPWREDAAGLERFYQFLLPPDQVRARVEAAGFRLVEEQGQDCARGLKEEWPACEPLVDRLWGLPWGIGKGIALSADWLAGRWFGHISHMVFVHE